MARLARQPHQVHTSPRLSRRLIATDSGQPFPCHRDPKALVIEADKLMPTLVHEGAGAEMKFWVT